MILLVVYVGAVAVLFLFVVMMLDVDFAELKKGALQYAPVGALVGIVLAAELIFVLGGSIFTPSLPKRRPNRSLRLKPCPTRLHWATFSTRNTPSTSRLQVSCCW